MARGKSKKLKVTYEFDDSLPKEEREARLSRAFKFIFEKYEEWLKKKRSTAHKM